MECSSKRLDTLRAHCGSLVRLCKEQSHYHVDDSDHLGFMSLCFLSKQSDHMETVLKLFPHPDMQLIARAMIEGLSQLLWCFNDPERAFQWRGYAWINDWKLTREMEAKGQAAPSDHKNNIEAFISEHGELFKIKKYKNKPIPEDVDPFHKNWRCGKDLNVITEEVRGEELYKMLYTPWSDWQHWGVAAMGKMITRDEDSIHYGKEDNFGNLCSALAVAFQCLYQVMELNNNYHDLGLEKKLSKIKQEYLQIHSLDR